jgi:hypothetical protein
MLIQQALANGPFRRNFKGRFGALFVLGSVVLGSPAVLAARRRGGKQGLSLSGYKAFTCAT